MVFPHQFIILMTNIAFLWASKDYAIQKIKDYRSKVLNFR